MAEVRDAVVDLRARRAAEANTKVVTRQNLREFLTAEKARMQGCTTLPLTVVVWLSVVQLLWVHGDTTSMYRLQQSVRETVESVQVGYTATGTNATRAVNFNNLGSTGELWLWLRDGLVPVLTGPPGRPGFVRAFNKVVGGVQLRQRRVDVDGCGRLEGTLADYYGSGCRTKQVSTSAFNPQNTTANDRAFTAGGGFALVDPLFYSWLDIRPPINGSGPLGRQRAGVLEAAGWIDDATEKVEVRVALFNPEVRAFVHVVASFTFQSGGLIQRTLASNPLPAEIFPSTWHIFYDVLWILVICVLFFAVLQEIADRVSVGWVVLDSANVIVGLALIGVFAFGAMRQAGLSKLLGDIGASAAPEIEDAAAARDYEGLVARLLDDLHYLVLQRMYHKLGMIVYLIFVVVRFFRGFAGNPRMATIVQSLQSALSDLMHLSVLLLVVFENFAIGGYVLFGAELSEWSTLLLANRRTLAAITGQGDFASMQSITQAGVVFWVVFFMLTLVFILSNLILAIMVNYHGQVRGVFGEAEQGLGEQIGTIWSDQRWKTAYDLRMLYRGLRARLSEKLPRRICKWLPILEGETRRIARVPFDALLQAVDKGEELVARGPHPWDPVPEDIFLKNGCDEATSRRLLGQCRARLGRHSTDGFPPARLCEEFEAAMRATYSKIDTTGEGLRHWFKARLGDYNKLEPRQRKLEILSKCIQPAPQQEWLEDEAYDQNAAVEDYEGQGEALVDGEGEGPKEMLPIMEG